MVKKITRRQLLKLMGIAAGSLFAAMTGLKNLTDTLAETADANDVFLPLVPAGISPHATAQPTLTPTTTPVVTLPPPGTFVDGPGGNVDTGKDVLISSSWHRRNGGQHADFQLEGLPGTIQHALLWFDLSSLPKGLTCSSAKLYLYHSYISEGGGANTGKVYCVSATNWPWIEGTGDIEIAQTGEPCWDAREADGSGGVQTAWAGSAGCSTEGVDYETSPLGSWSFDSGSARGTAIVIDLDPVRVRRWFGSPNANYGIILIADDDIHSAHVGSAEHAVAAYRPKLVVTYS